MGLFDSWKVVDQRITLDYSPAARHDANGLPLGPSSTLPFYTGGSVVKGTFCFTAKSEVKFRSISLKIVGREAVCPRTTLDELGHRYEVSNFFKHYIVMLGMAKRSRSEKTKGLDTADAKEWAGVLPPGDYSYPFAFRLPLDAPPTIVTSIEHSTLCSVEYLIKAQIDIPFGSDIVSELNFVVQNPMPLGQLQSAEAQRPFDSVGAPLGVPRTCCGCFDRGVTRSTIHMNKTTLIFGQREPLTGHVMIFNSDARVGIESIKVFIEERTVFKMRIRNAVDRSVRRLDEAQFFPAIVPPNAPQAHRVPFSFDVSALADRKPLVEARYYPEIAEYIDFYVPNKHHADVDVASGLCGSYNGQVISRNYYLVACIADGAGDGDSSLLLGEVLLTAAACIDNANVVTPISTDPTALNVTSRRQITKRGGYYNKHAYAAPPFTEAAVPHGAIGGGDGLSSPLGPLVGKGPASAGHVLLPLTFIDGAVNVCGDGSNGADGCAKPEIAAGSTVFGGNSHVVLAVAPPPIAPVGVMVVPAPEATAPPPPPASAASGQVITTIANELDPATNIVTTVTTVHVVPTPPTPQQQPSEQPRPAGRAINRPPPAPTAFQQNHPHMGLYSQTAGIAATAPPHHIAPAPATGEGAEKYSQQPFGAAATAAGGGGDFHIAPSVFSLNGPAAVGGGDHEPGIHYPSYNVSNYNTATTTAMSPQQHQYHHHPNIPSAEHQI